MMKILILFAAVLAVGSSLLRSRFRSSAHGSPFIVGGSDVTPMNKYPYNTMLQYDVGFAVWEHRCSAVLILKSNRANKAVTTGTCVSDTDGFLEDAERFRVLAGVYERDGSDAEVTVLVSAISRHPDYTVITNNRASADVAVLTLAVQLDRSNPRIDVASLSRTEDGDLVGWQGQVSGWGRIDRAGLTDPDNMQEIETTVLPSSTCQSRLNNIDLRNTITAEHVCVQATGKAPCLGDLGVPLTVTNTTSGAVRVGSIFSWAPGTFDEPCLTEYPTVFVRVSHFRDWIYAQ